MVGRQELQDYDALVVELGDVAQRIERIMKRKNELAHTLASDSVEGTREDGTHKVSSFSVLSSQENS